MPPKKNRRRRTRKYQQTRTNNNDFCLIPLEDITTPDENINNAEATTSNNSDLDNVAVIQKRCIDDEFFILGEGSFGLVTLGILKTPDGDTTKVALKAVNFEKRRSPGDVFTCREMLKEEAVVMAKFDHANVVRLLGVQKKPFKLVIEYMVHGDLLDAVKAGLFPTVDHLMDALRQITAGMAYICEQNYVHRDLACRNVFVANKNRCKIGDFGLCKYVGDSDGVYKIKEKQFWNPLVCDPEAMCTSTFTTKSDVWSLGLLAWELFLSAEGVPGPYKLMLLEGFMFTRKLPKPSLCPEELFAYVTDKLLNEDIAARPHFSQVKEDLGSIDYDDGSAAAVSKLGQLLRNLMFF